MASRGLFLSLEICNDKLPVVQQLSNPPIQAQGTAGKKNPDDGFHQAIPVREMRLPILSLVL